MLSLEAGAHTVISRWCRVQPGEKVLIISDERHVEESLALRAAADRCGAVVALLTIQERHSHPGSVFHSMKDFVLQNDVIIGATSFSLVTNRITQEVLSQGGRFLSLPLSSNNGQPALAFDFMSMDPEEAGRTGHGMLEALRQAGRIHITTALGTDLSFGKRGRQPGLFNGLADRPGKVGSSSFEIYIGIEETQTSGRAVVDGSLGYLGRPAAPIPLTFQEGRLVQIDGETGAELKRYMDSFGDPGIYVAGDSTGIEEANTAIEEGKIAGTAIAERLGYLDPKDADAACRAAWERLAGLRQGHNGDIRTKAKEGQIAKYREIMEGGN